MSSGVVGPEWLPKPSWPPFTVGVCTLEGEGYYINWRPPIWAHNGLYNRVISPPPTNMDAGKRLYPL